MNFKEYRCLCGQLLFKHDDNGNIEIKSGKQFVRMYKVTKIEVSCPRCKKTTAKE